MSDSGRGACVHELVEAQVERSPDAVAVVFGNSRVTYGELDDRANRLAHRLRALGARPEVRVGIHLDRSIELAVAVLAVLKAGAAYVPLDPDYPAPRLDLALKDARPEVLLTSGALHSRIVLPDGVVPLVVEGARPFDGAPVARLEGGARPGNLAYVMYTSGSTGLPRGVMVEHGAAAGYLSTAFSTYIPLSADDVVLQLASVAFDPSVRDLIGPLTRGSRVVLVRQGDARDPWRLLEAIREHGVTTLLAGVPSLLRGLLDAAAVEGTPLSLEATYVSGESFRSLRAYGDRLEQLGDLVNHYGTTECTLIATQHRVRASDGDVDSIGRPIAGATAHVLDASLEPVPPGEVGEIFVGGRGVARGYLEHPGLTAERFVPDPFGGRGARLYRTGDLARLQEDGALEYAGRVDDQVTIRGFRAELGDVDAALRALPAVEDAAAAVTSGTDVELVASVVLSEPHADVSELRALLRGTLPDHMIPSRFMRVRAIPLTPTGKVDRSAVAAGSPEHVAERETIDEPWTPLERTLAAIWLEVLPASEVRRDDDFFVLGGHSVVAARVVARVRQIFRVPLDVRAVFESPTLAELARAIDDAGPAPVEPRIERVRRDGALPLSYGQERLLFLDRLSQRPSEHVIPFAFRLRGELQLEPLRRALTEIVARHEVLRTTFALEAGEAVALLAPPTPVPLPVVDVDVPDQAGADEEAARLAREEASTAFDLAQPPLLRALVVRLGPQEHILVLSVHHIATDGRSFEILARELGALYAAFVTGLESPLPPLPFQYADFAAWQRTSLANGALEAEVAWWQNELDGLEPVELPADGARPSVWSGRGALRPFALDEASTAGLKELAAREGATPFLVLLAALELVLSRWSGMLRFTLGTAISGRPSEQLEDLVGFFVNTLVLCADVSGEPSFVELLHRVRAAAIDAYAHAELPFDRVVAGLRPPRALDRAPLAQVLLVLQDDPFAQLELAGIDVHPFVVDMGKAQYDMTLWLGDTGTTLAGWFEYSTDLFEAATIDRLASDLKQALADAVAEPTARLACGGLPSGG